MTPPELSSPAALLSALTQALHGVFRHLDARRYDAVLTCFTPDARWLRQGKWLHGRQAIGAALQERASDVETCHVMSNAFVIACDVRTATLEAYMTAYRYPCAGEGEGVPVIAGPLRVNHVITVFERQEGADWLIAEQRLLPLVAFQDT
ncbi:nuclear transport factor 2 family protein [Verticiella sediminum]|uniref:nuclear transport factor 2 family protein n=1 Tax=Verticiella sediminum TaxID=1247510 RepID=UPI0014787903|nr:nuclear transport factor 2 family protein [Verticiella sediminum]